MEQQKHSLALCSTTSVAGGPIVGSHLQVFPPIHVRLCLLFLHRGAGKMQVKNFPSEQPKSWSKPADSPSPTFHLPFPISSPPLYDDKVRYAERSLEYIYIYGPAQLVPPLVLSDDFPSLHPLSTSTICLKLPSAETFGGIYMWLRILHHKYNRRRWILCIHMCLEKALHASDPHDGAPPGLHLPSSAGNHGIITLLTDL